ncbi:MAG: histidine phosphatase family protein [Acidimicrobiia bacterium]
MNPLPDIWLVRHGTTEWSAQGRHTGRTDLPLTAEGRREAAAVFRTLDRQRFELVLTSPRIRARDTARLAGFADATVDDDLVEWDYGQYEGLTLDQIHERDPGWTIFTGAVPGGETAEQVGARAERVLDRVAGAEGPVLLFAHGHLLRVLTAVALELGPRAGARFALDPATVSVIGSEHRTRALARWNERAPLM